jgi:hypothetical protein
MRTELVKKAVALDNLRVPFVTSGKFKILSFRSKDPQFKADPGVIPREEQREKAGSTVVQAPYRHNDMRDTGSEEAKTSIQAMLDKFLVRNQERGCAGRAQHSQHHRTRPGHSLRTGCTRPELTGAGKTDGAMGDQQTSRPACFTMTQARR